MEILSVTIMLHIPKICNLSTQQVICVENMLIKDILRILCIVDLKSMLEKNSIQSFHRLLVGRMTQGLFQKVGTAGMSIHNKYQGIEVQKVEVQT